MSDLRHGYCDWHQAFATEDGYCPECPHPIDEASEEANALRAQLAERDAEIARLREELDVSGYVAKVDAIKADRNAFAAETQTYRDAWLKDQQKIADLQARLDSIVAYCRADGREGEVK